MTPSFDQLYEQLAPRVLALGVQLTGRRDDAEDILQNTFLQVYRYLPSWRGESNIATWVYRIALREGLRYRRKQQRPVALPEETPQRRSTTDPLERQETREQLYAALHQLPTAQRAVLALLTIEELSVEEVARIMNIPEGTVWSRAYHARRQLRRHLEPAHPDDAPQESTSNSVPARKVSR